MRTYILLLPFLAVMIVGCTEKVEYTEKEVPEFNTENAAVVKNQIDGTLNESKEIINESIEKTTPESGKTDKTGIEKEVETSKPRFFSARKLVLRDSKAGLKSTSDNLFIIYHEGGDSLPVKYIKILVFKNGRLLDELWFDSDAKYFKGINGRLKSSIIREENFEEGDEIIIIERPDFNIESGEILGVKIIDSKWNITLLDSFVQVW